MPCHAAKQFQILRTGNVGTIPARATEALGAEHRRLQAKLFGGACVLSSFQGSGNDLGSKNIEVARRRLEEEKIPVLAEDLGGNHGRRLVFRTDTGLALTKIV